MARRFPEFFQDENIVWSKTFYSDASQETPVDPTSVVFKLLSPTGNIISATVTDEPDTGNFSAQYTVDEYGDWNWRWETDEPRIIDQGTIFVKERNVP